MKKTILALLAFGFLFSSCKKESNNDSTCTLSSTNIVGAYKVTASTIQASSTSTPEDDYSTWDACEKDNIITFGAEGILTNAEGATSCDPAGDFIAQWSLSGNLVTISILGEAITGTISDYSCSGFKLTQIDDTSGEITITTFTRQ